LAAGAAARAILRPRTPGRAAARRDPGARDRDVSTIKPIFLLADSQLLFWRDGEEPFLRRARLLLEADEGPAGRAFRAAYLGASNGDAPEFYQLFVAAMDQIGIRDCRHVPAEPAAEDLEFLAGADLILLAGGEVRRGWDAFKAAGLDQKLVERYYGGALLVGISAGAVQLGLKGWDETGERTGDMLRIVPFVVDVHDEPSWGRLLQLVPKAGEYARGLGIPSGGGAIYHPDYSVEPVRHPLVEVSQGEQGVQQALLLPGQASPGREPAAGEHSDASGPGGGGQDASAGQSAGPGQGAGAASTTGAADEQERPRTIEEERRDLGYSVRTDGVIEIHRGGAGADRTDSTEPAAAAEAGEAAEADDPTDKAGETVN
jgi:Peptidase family S51